MGAITPEQSAAVFAALSYQDPQRLHLYLARVAIDHGRKALDALALGQEGVYQAHLMAYRRITRGLVEDGYWEPCAATQVSV